MFILSQLKAILPLLKLGKAGGAIITMAVSIWAYALRFPWQFAVGFVLLILVHEMGHVWASKRKGLPVSAPVFIPFLGAMINMKRHPRDAATEAYVAMGGPLVGTIGAAVVFAAAYATDSGLLYSLAYTGFFLNLINLLPIHPLDGGRIATAVTRWLWLVGLIGGLVVIVYLRSWLFGIIWAMFAYDLYVKYVKNRKGGEPHDIRAVSLTFMVPAEPLIEQGYLIPGPEHKRELPFKTYTDLQDETQRVELYWEGLQFHGTVPMTQQGIIHRAHVTGLERIQKEDGLQLAIHCQVDYSPYDNDKYYEVPPAVRWKFGIGYISLAAVLLAMMFSVHELSGISFFGR
ncbi:MULTISPECIES: site-2 protease family protein [unclassified Paenibacillus]|uniref:site-2 protease family protein n=1 Tax=unclassified Paenibacillus TaxID=185978 RepID=UPI00210DA455|nr:MULTISPECIES: site-2 protease family protein [unclassified Paenibacillus]